MPESLDMIDAMRRRPGMYIGDVHDGSGLVHMIWEVVANSIDEHLSGRCQTILVTLHDEASVTIEDDGRGIPVEPLPDGTSFLETVLTRLHDRATFDGHRRHVHVGLHGVGVVVVNALSSQTHVETVREGRLFHQDFLAGRVASALEDVGPTARKGTRITFTPDAAIFAIRDFDASAIRSRLQAVAGLCPGLSIRFADKRISDFACPRGIEDLLMRERRGLSASPDLPLRASTETEGIRVDVVFQWVKYAAQARVRSFVNLHETHEGGTHVTGLQRGLHELVSTVAPHERRARARELQSRVLGIISVFHHDPTYDSPTKSLLKSPEVQPIVEDVVRRCLREFAAQRPDEARCVITGEGQ